MSAGEMAATIAVLELPPKFSRKSQVSTESRNGIKSEPFFFFDLELAWKIFWNSGNDNATYTIIILYYIYTRKGINFNHFLYWNLEEKSWFAFF